MARSHGKIYAAIWADPDFVGLPAAAQRLYFLLLSQPKLTLAGSLDVSLKRWAPLAVDTDQDDIGLALMELAEAGYVVVDETTDEVIIRTFARHDLDPNRLSSKVAKGFWSAWNAILSANLRKQVVDNCPDDLWEKIEPHAPPDARQIPRSAPINRGSPPPIDREPPPPIESKRPPPTDTPVACHLSPVTSSLTQYNSNQEATAERLPDRERP